MFFELFKKKPAPPKQKEKREVGKLVATFISRSEYEAEIFEREFVGYTYKWNGFGETFIEVTSARTLFNGYLERCQRRGSYSVTEKTRVPVHMISLITIDETKHEVEVEI